MILAVEGLHALALFRGADDDVPAVHAGEVERVHRLAVFQHDVVGDVDDIVDRTHACGADALAHPQGRRLDLDVLDKPRGVARAERGIVNVDLCVRGDVAADGFDLGRVEVQRAVERGARLAGEADDAQAVGTIRRDLELDNGVVKADGLGDVLAGLQMLRREIGVVVQQEQPLLGVVRPVVVGHAQLVPRAAHAVGRDAAQRARLDGLAAGQHRAGQRHGDEVADLLVLRAGDDLDGLVLSDVDLTDPHVVAVLVARHFEDPADHDVFDLAALAGDGLHLGAGERHFIVELLVADVAQVDELVQPSSA